MEQCYQALNAKYKGDEDGDKYELENMGLQCPNCDDGDNNILPDEMGSVDGAEICKCCGSEFQPYDFKGKEWL